MKMVLAIGGNSLIHNGETGTVEEQAANSREVATQIVELLREGHRIVVTHGNGPQVGAELLLSEGAAGVVPRHPLDLCDAATQGEMGYLLQRALDSEMKRVGLNVPVATLVTQCVVSMQDPAMKNPTKPVGRFYSSEEAEDRKRKYGWTMVMDAERGYRRLVPSPRPLEIVELEAIRQLVNAGALVIACGGGGIPVAWANGKLTGVEAVIDKDLASALLASKLGVEMFVIGTDAHFVYLDYQQPSERPLRRINAVQLQRYLRAGQFAPGSMGPKIQAVLEFLRQGGKQAVIAPVEGLCAAVRNGTGTHILFGDEDVSPSTEELELAVLARE